MEQKILYTAIGRLERETNSCGRSCPLIRLGGQPYMMDMQEMVVWTPELADLQTRGHLAAVR